MLAGVVVLTGKLPPWTMFVDFGPHVGLRPSRTDSDRIRLGKEPVSAGVSDSLRLPARLPYERSASRPTYLTGGDEGATGTVDFFLGP